MLSEEMTRREALYGGGRSWLTDLARPAVRSMVAYSSARSLAKGQMGGADDQSPMSYLDANELADHWGDLPGLPPRANRYPDPQPPRLLDLLAAIYQVPTRYLCVGAGADAAIDALIRVYCEAGSGGIVITPPTYGYYEVAARIQGAPVLSAPLVGPGLALDPSAVERAVDAGGRLVFVCSPNNPTGHMLGRDTILELEERLRGRALVVVDEAYIEFSGQESLAPLVGVRPGLVVLRTLSKAWGLAGLRVGTAIASPEVTDLLHKVRFPYPVARPSSDAASEILPQLMGEGMVQRIAAIAAERERLAAGLRTSPLVERVWPSVTNFLMVTCLDHGEFLRRTKMEHLVVRDRSREPCLERGVRVTVGSPAENRRLIAAVGGRLP